MKAMPELNPETKNKATKLEEDGYVILEDVYDRDFIEKRKTLAEEIIRFQKEGYFDSFSAPACNFNIHNVDDGWIYHVYQRYPIFQELASNEQILDTLEQVIGPNIQLAMSDIIFKPSSGDNEIQLHRGGHPNEKNPPVAYHAWTPLENVDENNGCLKVDPGTHRKEIPEWKDDGLIDVEAYDASNVSHLPMNSGDVLLFNDKIVHGSDATRSSSNRFALRVRYRNPTVDHLDRRSEDPIMLRGGTPDDLLSQNLHLSKGALEGDRPVHVKFLRSLAFEILSRY